MLASILKKTVMALTGLAWFIFLIGHLAGNLLLFKGSDDFNAYAELLHGTGFLLYFAEVTLVALLGLHIYSALRVSRENRAARPVDYELKRTNGKATVYSRSMLVGGVILAVFIIVHVITFKFGDHSGPGGLYGLVIRTYQNPLTVAWYMLALVALGMHLSHGFGSAFQTLGVSRTRWRARFWIAGAVFGWLVAGGFMALPLFAFIKF